MKKLLFLLVISIMPSNMMSQESVFPLLEDGKAWHYTYYNWATGLTYKFVEFISGDTLINGLSYKKYLNEDSEVIGLLRESDGKVFVYNTGNHSEAQLYDFTLSIGDDAGIKDTQEGFVVTDINDVVFQSLNLKQFTLNQWYYKEGEGKVVDAERQDVWVEGMGSSGGLMTPYPSILAGNYVSLDYIEMEDGTTFSFREISKVPIMNNDESDKGHSIFDLSGKKVSSTSKGVYIQNGKKFVIK